MIIVRYVSYDLAVMMNTSFENKYFNMRKISTDFSGAFLQCVANSTGNYGFYEIKILFLNLLQFEFRGV